MYYFYKINNRKKINQSSRIKKSEGKKNRGKKKKRVYQIKIQTIIKNINKKVF